MNIYELAKKANVSIATVSRAINPETRKKVTLETLSRIDALVNTYGYTPNINAKNLSSAKSNTIGILLPKLTNLFLIDYYTKVIAGITDGLLDSNYTFKPLLLKFSGDKWDNFNFKKTYGLDGLVIVDWPLFFSNISAVEKLGAPSVLINDPVPNVRLNFSTSDHLQGGEIAAEYLYSCGHRHIVIVNGSSWSKDCALRIEGFMNFIKKKGKTSLVKIISGDFQEPIAAHAAEQALKRDHKITAFFCCNDAMAFGVLNKLKQLGIACPEKISVLGYDGDNSAAFTDPPLSTVRVPVYEMAKEGIKNLVRYLDGEEETFYKQTVFQVALIKRKSVGVIT